MPTLYVTPEEYAALGEDQVLALKASGEDVVVVADDTAADRASWAEAAGVDPKDHVPDVKVSFMPVSGQGEKAPASDPEVPAEVASDDQSVALLKELVALQRESLAEARALRVDIAQMLKALSGQSATLPTPPGPFVPVKMPNVEGVLQSIQQQTQAAPGDDTRASIESMIEALDAEIAKARGESGSD